VTSAVGVRTEPAAWINPAIPAAVVLSGCILLAARPALLNATAHPTALLMILFATLLAVAVAWPGVRREPARLSIAALILILGVTALMLGRLLGGGHAPAAPTIRLIAANTLAAVAEEAWFRRLCYDVLLDAGPLWAIGGSAVLFALVHLGVYGVWVLPLDLAVGLLLGWQRWASGSWHAPAVTHVLANVLVVI
jgi:hypothetical protein